MELEGSLLCSQEPTSGPCHEPDESSPQLPTHHLGLSIGLFALKSARSGIPRYFFHALSGIAQGYGLDDWGFESRQGLGISLHHRVQTVCGAHPASCPMGTRGSFRWR
jgi:hypothetical protein